jgi:FkbM family methyltransferase
MVFFDDDSLAEADVTPLLASAPASEVTLLAEGRARALLRKLGRESVALPRCTALELGRFLASFGFELIVDPRGPTPSGRLSALAFQCAPRQVSLGPPLLARAACFERLDGADPGAPSGWRRVWRHTLPPLPDGSRVLPLEPDLDQVLPASLAVLTSYVIAEQGRWFEDELDFCLALLREGDVVLDVGANFGSFALPMARRVGPRGKVLAFEPSATTAACLRASAERNGLHWLRVEQAAVGETRGTATLAHGPTPELHQLGDGPGEVVAVHALHEVESELRGLRLLKLDAEGFELPILRGGEALLRETRPVILFELRHQKAVNRELVSFLRALGFESFAYQPGLGALVPYELPADTDDPSIPLNLVAVHPSRWASLAEQGLLVEPPRAGLTPPRAPRVEPDARRLFEAPFASNLPPQRVDGLVALGLVAFDPRHPVVARFAALDEAVARATPIATGRVSPADPYERLTCARLLRAAGQRTLAAACLHPLVPSPRELAAPVRPFLPALPSYEQAPIDDLNSLVERQCIEALEYWRYFSGILADPNREPLRRYRQLGGDSPWMARRLALTALRLSQPLG